MLRATRQYTDVLKTGTGKARATRQYIDVAIRIPTPVEEEREFESVLALTGEAEYYIARAVGDNLGLSQEIVIQLDLVRAQESVLNLEQTIIKISPIHALVEHDLGVAGSTTGVYPYYESLEDDLGLEGRSDVVQSVTSILNLASVINRVAIVEVNHTLDLSGEELKRDISESELALIQIVEWGYGGSVSDAVGLVQTIDAKLILIKAQSHVLAIQQSVAYFIANRRVDQQYSPFTEEGSAVSPTLNEPMDGIEAPFQLVYPAVGEVTDSVTLRAPNLGNKDRLSFNRISRETRGGTLIVFADPIWPKIQTHVLSFSALRRTEAQDLLDFIGDYLGQEVGMIDWEQRFWRGIITVADEPIVEDSFNAYTVSFQFEGELDETWTPQVIPWVPDTPLRRVRPDDYYDCENPLEPEPEPGVEASYAAEADESILVGQPVYIKATGHAALAIADAAIPAGAIGFAITAAEATFTVRYITEGKITLTDWTDIIGVSALTPGKVYYLDATTAGRITAVAPSVLSQYVVRVGRAASFQTFDIEVDSSVYL